MIDVLLNILKKEFTLVLKDVHALLVLFIMPMAFIMVMSLAMPDSEADNKEDQPKIGLIFLHEKDADLAAASALTQLPGFRTQKFTNKNNIREDIIDEQLIAMIVVPENYIQQLQINDVVEKNLDIFYSPSTPSQLRYLLMSSIRQVIALWQKG